MIYDSAEIIIASKKSIDSFILEASKILMDGESNLPIKYNDGINEKQIINNFMSMGEMLMDTQVYKCMLSHYNSDIIGNNIVEILDLIKSYPYLCGDEFNNTDLLKIIENKYINIDDISEVTEFIKIMRQYEYYKLYKEGKHLLNKNIILTELQNIRKVQENRIMSIIKYFYDIQNNKMNNIQYIILLINNIIKICAEALNFYENISYNISLLLTDELNCCIKQFCKSIKINAKKCDTCSIDILSNNFEKQLKSDINIKNNIDQINKLYKYSIALSDKLTVIFNI
jgi:hypothetical protein